MILLFYLFGALSFLVEAGMQATRRSALFRPIYFSYVEKNITTRRQSWQWLHKNNKQHLFHNVTAWLEYFITISLLCKLKTNNCCIFATNCTNCCKLFRIFQMPCLFIEKMHMPNFFWILCIKNRWDRLICVGSFQTVRGLPFRMAKKCSSSTVARRSLIVLDLGLMGLLWLVLGIQCTSD